MSELIWPGTPHRSSFLLVVPVPSEAAPKVLVDASFPRVLLSGAQRSIRHFCSGVRRSERRLCSRSMLSLFYCSFQSYLRSNHGRVQRSHDGFRTTRDASLEEKYDLAGQLLLAQDEASLPIRDGEKYP